MSVLSGRPVPFRTYAEATLAATSWAILTSLDGDLLNFQTDRYNSARETIAYLDASGIPLVAVTEKSFDEVEPQTRELGLQRALIFEGGACLAVFETGQWRFERYGPDADSMLDIIRDVELMAGADLSVYSVMPAPEASRVTGLSGEALVRSQNRLSDEPFIVSRGKAEKVAAAAKKLGYSLRRDGALHHLYDPADLKRAVERVREQLHCRTIAGIGSAATDARFLSLCDRAVIVPRETGVDPEIVKGVPGASVAPSSGPCGWLATAQELSSLRLSEGNGVADIVGAHLPKRRSRNVSSRTLSLSPENS